MEGGGVMKPWIIVVFVILVGLRFVASSGSVVGDTPETPCRIYTQYFEHCTEEAAIEKCKKMFGKDFLRAYCRT